MPLPPVLEPDYERGRTSYYSMTMQEAVSEIVPGMKTTVRTFNGSFPAR